MLFDDAVEHITQFVSQDLWEEYKSESTFQEFSAHLSSALSLGKTPSLLISIRWLGCTMRHVIPLSKRVVTIGSGNACDIAVIEAGSVNTMVINIELQPAGGGALVSMLWNASPQRAREIPLQCTFYGRFDVRALAAKRHCKIQAKEYQIRRLLHRW